MLLKALIGIVTCLFLMAQPADAAATGEHPARTPLGYKMYCTTQPERCVRHEQEMIPFTNEMVNALQRVNILINQAIKPVAEPPGQDEWVESPSNYMGDCEDYALTKRAVLLKAGVPPGAFMLVVVQMPDGLYHAVLAVRTDSVEYDGMLMLDNLTDRITWLAETKYEIISFLY